MANARLIAAAPELLAALRDCVQAIDDEVAADAGDRHPVVMAHAKAADKGRAAIAKATEGATA